MAHSSIRRAVLLAAGRGTRMGSITDDLPKPMLAVAGRPMLEHILERLSEAGIAEFCIIVGYRHEAIEEHFKRSQYKIRFVRQAVVNGTGSAALLARDFTGDDPFLLSYGDILCEPSDYSRCFALLESHAATSAILAVREVEDPWQGAAVYELAGRVKKIVEKPPKGTSMTRWNSAGFYLFQAALYRYLDRIEPSPRGELELTSALALMLGDRLDLRISPVTGLWRDVGRPEDLAAMNATP